MKTGQSDIAIVGAGVVGLAQAWSAAKEGFRVALFERSPLAMGASVRNFGTIWPIGQPAGPMYEIAVRSRASWLELTEKADVWSRECGSIHLAYRDDEKRVAQEFIDSQFGRLAQATWLTAEEVSRRSPAAKTAGLLGGMWSPTELCVNPRKAIAQIPTFLEQQYPHLQLHWGRCVTAATTGELKLADGGSHLADRIVVCGGHDTQTLFPGLYEQLEIYDCKLQMMRTVRQAKHWRIGPHLAGGLTLQHYASFRNCDALASLRERIEEETPELNAYGIHVMAAQNDDGEVVLGDSHQYDKDVSPFDSAEIESLMLRELRRIIDLPDWTIQQRWHGVYAKHATHSVIHAKPLDDVHVILLPG